MNGMENQKWYIHVSPLKGIAKAGLMVGDEIVGYGYGRSIPVILLAGVLLPSGANIRNIICVCPRYHFGGGSGLRAASLDSNHPRRAPSRR